MGTTFPQMSPASEQSPGLLPGQPGQMGLERGMDCAIARFSRRQERVGRLVRFESNRAHLAGEVVLITRDLRYRPPSLTGGGVIGRYWEAQRARGPPGARSRGSGR